MAARPSLAQGRKRQAGASFATQGAGFKKGRSAAWVPRYQSRGRKAVANGEMKFHDVDVDDAAIAQNGTIQNAGSVNLIGQGVTESTRIGRKCTIQQIGYRFQMTMSTQAAITNSADTVRVILYEDKQCNGATAAITDILQTDDFQSFNNLNNKSRFRTLMDRTYDLNAGAGAGNGTANDTGPVELHDSFYAKVNIPLEISGTDASPDITTIRTNNLGVLLLSKNGGVTVFESKLRLRFSDG